MGETLVVFDFDNTILDDNSDTAILALTDKEQIPQDIKNIQFTEGWTAFMQAIFNYLHETGVKSDEIKTLVEDLPPTNGMINLISQLNSKKNYDLIIISDSNSLFIHVWLEKQGLSTSFKRVFTNTCNVIQDKLEIVPFHYQDSCKLSTSNLCKGQIMEDFVECQQHNGVVYNKIIYIGDGVNDFCPVLRLTVRDLVFVRNNFKLCELVNKAKKGLSIDPAGKPHIVKAEVVTWDSGDDIVKYLNLV